MHVQEGVWQELCVQEEMHEVPQWMFLQWELLCMMVERSGEYVIRNYK
jgi:hypothetical protein